MGRPPSRDDTVTSHEILNDHGLAVPNWPVEWGGLARRVRRKGLDRTQHQIWLDEMQLASVRMPARSDPVPGSVMAIAVMSSPDAMPGMDARRSFHGLQVELGNAPRVASDFWSRRHGAKKHRNGWLPGAIGADECHTLERPAVRRVASDVHLVVAPL